MEIPTKVEKASEQVELQGLVGMVVAVVVVCWCGGGRGRGRGRGCGRGRFAGGLWHTLGCSSMNNDTHSNKEGCPHQESNLGCRGHNATS